MKLWNVWSEVHGQYHLSSQIYSLLLLKTWLDTCQSKVYWSQEVLYFFYIICAIRKFKTAFHLFHSITCTPYHHNRKSILCFAWSNELHSEEVWSAARGNNLVKQQIKPNITFIQKRWKMRFLWILCKLPAVRYCANGNQLGIKDRTNQLLAWTWRIITLTTLSMSISILHHPLNPDILLEHYLNTNFKALFFYLNMSLVQ
jgi:hypothetical protein